MMTLLKFQVRFLTVKNFARGLKNSIRIYWFYASQFLEHGTPAKAINFLTAKAQKWFKRDRLASMPYRYVIDPINLCNLHCPLCPTGLGILGRDRGKISLDNFRLIVDQIVPYAYLVELYNWGEPFLHPQIFEIIQYVTSRRIGVRISSNLNRFNQEMARKTVASGLDQLIVSVDGTTQEVYEKYRKGGKLDRVLDNLRLLVQAKREAGSSKPFIFFRVVINRYNEHQIKDMRALAAEIGADAFTAGALFIDTTDKQQRQEWLPEDQSLSYYDYADDKITNVWHCSDLWESVTINWDGGLAPCCWLHEHKNDYENAFNRPIREIWNGDAYISSRRVFAFGGPKEGPVTTICTVCKGRPQYLKD